MHRRLSICFLIYTLIVLASSSCTTASKSSGTYGYDPSQAHIDELFFIEGQLCQHLRKIFQDSNGDLWFGTNVYGLMHYDGDTLRYYNEEDGLGGGRITGILEDKERRLWVATHNGLSMHKLSMRDHDAVVRFKTYNAENYFLSNDNWSLFIDSKEEIWLGTIDGVVKFDGERFTKFPVLKGAVPDTTSILSYDRIVSIMEDKNGHMWFAIDGFGITIYNPEMEEEGAFRFLTEENGLQDNNIANLMRDSRGDLWIGSMFGGMSKYDGMNFTHYAKEGIVSGPETYALYEDSKGQIWFASENFGVYMYDGQSFLNLYTEEGLQTNGILSIYEDKEGRIWFGGWGGLFRYDPSGILSDDIRLIVPVTRDGPWE